MPAFIFPVARAEDLLTIHKESDDRRRDGVDDLAQEDQRAGEAARKPDDVVEKDERISEPHRPDEIVEDVADAESQLLAPRQRSGCPPLCIIGHLDLLGVRTTYTHNPVVISS